MNGDEFATAPTTLDVDDSTYCTVDQGDVHNVTVDYTWPVGPSNTVTINAFRIYARNINPRAFFSAVSVNCGDNESGQSGRPLVWQAPPGLLNQNALETLIIQPDSPC